jgi:hypothetical protein
MVSKVMNIENLECSKLLSIKFLALAVCSTLRKSKYFIDVPTMVFSQHCFEINILSPSPPKLPFYQWGHLRLKKTKDFL